MLDYPLDAAAVSLAGGNVRFNIFCDEEANWYPDIEDIVEKSPNTKAIVVINPNNPTGALSR